MKVRNGTETAAPPAPRSRELDSLDASVKPYAEWMDEHVGNGDGFLDGDELRRFQARYGDTPGYAERVIPQLDAALGSSTQPTGTVRTADLQAAESHAALVRSLIQTGGSATEEDIRAVAPELARIPTALLRRAHREGIRVVVCRDNVTDHLTELAGQRPRGWPPGSDWSSVPGAYYPQTKQVVVATTSGSNGERIARATGNGHGSISLLLHEFGHGLDRAGKLDSPSQSPEFIAAYEADRQRLEAQGEHYMLQSGVAGREEAFAELFARHFSGDQTLAAELPNLSRYIGEFARTTGGLR